MLCVLFKAASQRYAVKALLVDEVTPLTRLSPLPGAPDYVSGIMNLRGEPVPVVDLTMLLCGRPSRLWASTRILAVRLASSAATAAGDPVATSRSAPGRTPSRRTDAQNVSRAPLVGLMAERAMRAVRIETDRIRPPKAPAAAYVAGVAVTERGIIEILDPAKLLPAEFFQHLAETSEDA